MAENNQAQGQQLQKRLDGLITRWSAGKVTLKEILGLSEEELFSIASQGYLLFLQGKNQSARVIFEGCVACDPKNAYYYRALGCIYWRDGEPQKAIKQFNNAIRVAPREVSTYINRAEVFVASSEFDKARADLNFALKHAGPQQSALVSKARAILRMLPRR